MAVKHCASCGAAIEGRMTEKCPAGGGSHKFARADFEKQETEEREAAAAKKKPGK
jgi:hypothetical protein